MRRIPGREIALAVRVLRMLRGLSYAELAARSDLDEGYLRGIEAGKREISLGALGFLAKGLDCDAADLLGRDPERVLRDLAAHMPKDIPMTPAPNAVRWAPYKPDPAPATEEHHGHVLRALLAGLDDAPVTPGPEAQRCPTWHPPKRKR